MRRFRKGTGKEGNTQQQSASIFGLAVLGSCFDVISYLGEFVIATEECWDRPTEWRSLLLLAAVCCHRSWAVCSTKVYRGDARRKRKPGQTFWSASFGSLAPKLLWFDGRADKRMREVGLKRASLNYPASKRGKEGMTLFHTLVN